MNFKIKTIIGCLLMASFFVACNQKEDTTKTPEAPETEKKIVKKVWQPEDMESSELALLMRAMWDSSMVRKAQIVSGENVNAYADLFNELHTAEATKVKNNIDVFNSFADVFEQNMKQVDAAESDSAKVKAFNNLVTTCVSCHQQYCQGPIPKIKKLYIKE